MKAGEMVTTPSGDQVTASTEFVIAGPDSAHPWEWMVRDTTGRWWWERELDRYAGRESTNRYLTTPSASP